MSGVLVARDGPLAHVWLASNYEKKLSRTQFLKTDLVESLHYLESRPLDSSSGAQPITLRLLGQLLLGLARIYSRKTKYLLDDIHDTLYKLRSSFTNASGATLGSATVASMINLPPQRTTANLSRITLEDQITSLDLFFQEDLVLDEPTSPIEPQTPDRSIEIGRRDSHVPSDEPSVDLDLNFDLDIELGRDAQPAMPEEQSFFELKDPLLGEPLQLVDETTPNQPGQTASPGPEPAQQRPQRRTLVGVLETGVKTTKRRLVVDSQEDVERGIPTEVLKDIQTMQTHSRLADETLTVKLTLQEKFELIQELSTSLFKRRKILDVDAQLQARCNELAQAPASPISESGIDIDFDLSLPELDIPQDEETPENDTTAEQTADAERVSATPESEPDNEITPTQIAGQLRNKFLDTPSVSLDALVYSKSKKDAARCFFGLLVLASHDCVTLEQEKPASNGLAQNLTARPRDNLVTNFL